MYEIFLAADSNVEAFVSLAKFTVVCAAAVAIVWLLVRAD